jgi:hypothetical protein
MSVKEKSNSRSALEKVLFSALSIIRDAGGSMDRLEVRDAMRNQMDFTEWELASPNSSKHPRWWIFLNWNTANLIRADFLIKSKGVWSITEKGREALDKYSEEELFEYSRNAYREWHKKNRGDEDGEDRNWITKNLFFHGLNLINQLPGGKVHKNEFASKVIKVLPEDVLEEATEHEFSDSKYNRAVGRAAKAGWLKRHSGTWSITESGKNALDEFDSPNSLWDAYRASKGERIDDDSRPLPYLGAVNNLGDIPPTIYSPRNLTVKQILSAIASKSIGLPDIQRPFVWKDAKVRDLLDSMFRGFPFGYILTWRTPGDNTRTRDIGTATDSNTIPHELIIDGQQRLTSLFAVMHGGKIVDDNFNEKTIEIAFHPIEGVFKVADNAVRKSVEWISNITDVFTSELGVYSVIENYLDALELSREIEQDHRIAVQDNLQRLFNLQNTPINVLEIGQDADEEQVAEIFVRINSKGQNLKQADFILTLLAVFWEEGRRDLEEFCRGCQQPTADNAPNPFNHLLRPSPGELLRSVVAYSHRRARLSSAYQLLRGKDLQTGVITVKSRDENLKILAEAQDEVLNPTNWHEYIKVLEQAGYRNPQMITSMNAVLITYSFFLIGREDFNVGITDLKNLIARWFFFINLTGRYSGSAESIMEEDLNRIKMVENKSKEGFKQSLNSMMFAELTDDFWTFTLPMRLESSSTRSIYTFFASQAILHSKALYSTLEVSHLLSPERRSTRKNLEIHHLFPKAMLKSNGIKGRREINQIANQTLVEWSVNLDIGDAHPKDYAPTLETKLDKSLCQNTNKLHAMPSKWWEMEYFEFLNERRKLMASVIREAFEALDQE